jgi:excisionase family DNA binding protein
VKTYVVPLGAKTSKTVKEWAEYLGCHPETLRVAIRRKQLLATIRPLSLGPEYEITPEDMQAFLEKRRTARTR